MYPNAGVSCLNQHILISAGANKFTEFPNVAWQWLESSLWKFDVSSWMRGSQKSSNGQHFEKYPIPDVKSFSFFSSWSFPRMDIWKNHMVFFTCGKRKCHLGSTRQLYECHVHIQEALALVFTFKVQYIFVYFWGLQPIFRCHIYIDPVGHFPNPVISEGNMNHCNNHNNHNNRNNQNNLNNPKFVYWIIPVIHLS